MDGDIAPVTDIISIAERYGATVLIDDAHATGVLGKTGRGTLERAGIPPGNPTIVQMGTLGKAFGTFGAFIAGDKDLVELLISRARSFIYTTALPPSVCAAARRAIELSEEEPERRLNLLANAAFMREGLKRAGLDTLSSKTQIIPVLVGRGRPERTMDITLKLLEEGLFIQGIRPPTVPENTARLRITEGLFIQGIRPPTVPENTARLRITVTAGHTREELEGALDTVIGLFRGGLS
jgi:glycine C-acetyltransferase